ncbi:hypothetical protein FNH22_08325 [Fulvivirga sp. M361]|uniref:LamG-like jellyroll fold domain-containing protein n=1 Tax=Fulvivirga sp. M361 TaxID=2594266 RepID=UPI00117B7FD5|nr:LamG-like jellyroll fold domain-containing protein [Fulvivirga sp. M361]TRX60046.1 hypothetical protein FNH22_08325 [Fulvivirga sp. M361]
MKTKALLLFGLFIGSFLTFTSCGDDDSGSVNLDSNLVAQWETEVEEARQLAANSQEGSLPGDYFPGAIAQLEEEIAKAQDIFDRATADIRIESALLVLEFALKEFEVSLVQEAIPLFSNLASEMLSTVPDAALSPDEFTAEFRVRLQSYDADQIVADMVGTLNQVSGLNTSGWAIRYFTTPFANTGVVDFIIGVGPEAPFFVEPDVPDYIIPLNEWVHIAATYNNQNMKLYIDGVKLLEFDSPLPMNPDPAGSFFRIGNSVFKDGRYTNGNIIDVRFWDVERTEEEINDNLSDFLEPPFDHPNLKLYFPLNANLGKVLTDETKTYKVDVAGVTWQEQ